MHKVFLILLTFFTFSLFFPSALYSQAHSSFDTKIASEYTISDDYSATAVHSVSLKNLTEFIYAPFFTMELEGEVSEIEVAGQNGTPIRYEVVDEDKKKIRVIFDNTNAGLGNIRTFTISYDLDGIAQKKGNLREIYIPGISAESPVSEKSIIVHPPSSWGAPSIAKPMRFEVRRNEYYFDGKFDLGGGVLMVFGHEQFYSVKLVYNLKNPNIFPAEREIALPPSTSNQDVVIKKIEPSPAKIRIDPDGNWLATYPIPPGETVEINEEFFVRTYKGKSGPLSEANRRKYLREDEYWEVKSRTIREASSQLTDAKSISDYVVDVLSYDLAKAGDDRRRYGAERALQNPESAVCLEYSDLFVALARAKDIPARSIEGYAFSDNIDTRPLSLVKDILHAWPEFYDDEQGTWRMIDPTWTDTTGGLDYFNSFDFDHIAFVIKGSSSRYPIPAGAYKLDASAKDIEVNLLEEKEFIKRQQLILTPHVRPAHFSLLPLYVDVTVKNTGDTIFKSGQITFHSELLKDDATVDFPDLAPGEEKDLRVRLEPRSLLTKQSLAITMRFGGEITLMNIDITPYPPSKWIIIGGIISGVTAGFVIAARKAGYLYVPGRKRDNSVRRQSQKP